MRKPKPPLPAFALAVVFGVIVGVAAAVLAPFPILSGFDLRHPTPQLRAALRLADIIQVICIVAGPLSAVAVLETFRWLSRH